MKRLITNFKKTYLGLVALFVFSVGMNIQQTQAQCINTSSWGSGTVTNSGNLVSFTTCAYAGDYSPITISNAGLIQFNSNLAGAYITLTTNTNVVVGHGPAPLVVPVTTTGAYRVHLNLNASCGTASNCQTLNGQWMGPGCSQPTALAANNVTLNSADFDWTAGGTETEWDVYYGIAPLAAPTAGTTPNVSGHASTTFNATGLLTAANYEFYIRSDCDANGLSSWSGPISFTTLSNCPAPTALAHAIVDPETVDLTWLAGANNETEWVVQYGAPGFAPGTGMQNGVSTTPANQLTGLTENTAYNVYVRGVCVAGDSSTWHGPISFTTPFWCPVPSSLITSVVDPETVQLFWTAGINNETEWEIEYGPVGFTAGTGTIVSVTPNPTTTITGLTQNTAYSFYVRAVCSSTHSSLWVGPENVTTPLWCPNPSGLGATVVAGDANLTWTPGAGAETEWNVQYGPTGFTLGNGTSYTTTNNNPDVLTGLAGSMIYQYYVQASCASGDTSLFVGPFSFTMPITNDEACDAITLPIDGQNRFFHNQGATATESGIITVPATGCSTNDGWCNSTISNSVWFEIVAPASGNVIVSSTATTLDGQLALFSATDCADYTTFDLIAANDDFGGLSPELSACGLTPGETYFVMYDPYSAGVHNNFAMRVEEVIVSAGVDGSISVCSTEDELDLETVITGQDAGGNWSFDVNPNALDGSLFNATSVPSSTYTIEYAVENGCARDTALATVTIVQPASSGTAVSPFNACNTGTVFLPNGLTGTITTGGTWTDNTATGLLFTNQFEAKGLPVGTYQFTYTVGNGGICPPSSTQVTVNLQNCTSVEENNMAFSIYPNPNNGQFFVTTNATELVTFEVMDITGKIVYKSNVTMNAGVQNEINVSDVATGMYIVKMSSERGVSTQNVIIK